MIPSKMANKANDLIMSSVKVAIIASARYVSPVMQINKAIQVLRLNIIIKANDIARQSISLEPDGIKLANIDSRSLEKCIVLV